MAEFIFENFPENCQYRGEGNASLVVSVKLGSESKVLRLVKQDSSQKVVATAEALHEELDEQLLATKNIMVPLLGNDLVHLPMIVPVTAEQVQKINEIVENCRPSHRRHKSVIERDTCALVLPDFCALPGKFADYDTEGPVIAIEVKPKQGFMKNVSHPGVSGNPVPCAYCMRQYYKLHTNTVSKKSGYCPIELFSGCPKRVKRCILTFFDTPQNNFRLFKDQQLIYAEEKRCDLSHELKSFFVSSVQNRCFQDRLAGLIMQVLLRPLKSPCFSRHSENEAANKRCAKHTVECCSPDSTCSHTLPNGCVLDRILRIQLLDNCSVDEVHKFYCQLKSMNENDVNAKNIGVLLRSQIPCHFAEKNRVLDESEVEFMSRKVWEFLLALTLKDCSLMLTFKKLRMEAERHSPKEGTLGENIVTCEDGSSYLYSLAVVDLDMKAHKKVEKIYSDSSIIVETYLNAEVGT